MFVQNTFISDIAHPPAAEFFYGDRPDCPKVHYRLIPGDLAAALASSLLG